MELNIEYQKMLDLVYNYFIDNSYNNDIHYIRTIKAIKDNDINISLQLLKLHLLKYRRIICLICLIFLIIIGIYCNPYNGCNFMDDDKNDKKYGELDGGGVVSSIKGAGKYVGNKYAAVRDKIKSEYVRGDIAIKQSSIVRGTKWLGKKTGAVSAAKYGYNKAMKYSGNAADTFAAYSGAIYSVIYQIAFGAIICIMFMPSLVFAIGGIICFTLLKNKLNYLKGL